MDAEWCLVERQRLLDLYLEVMRSLVEQLISSGLYEPALSYAHSWLVADRLDEAAHQALMRIYCAMKQPAKALRGRALALAAEACWFSGRNDGGTALAREGLELANALGDREAEARLSLVLGLNLREGFHLEEAQKAFGRAVEVIPSLTDVWDVLWLVLQRGILALLVGDLAESERFLREALSLRRLLASSASFFIKQAE